MQSTSKLTWNVSQDGTVMNDAHEIAGNFNNQFASVFTAENLQQMLDPVHVLWDADKHKLLDISSSPKVKSS